MELESFFGCVKPPCANEMQGRRSRPKNDSNTRAPYLSIWVKMAHGREMELKNDSKPDLRQILTPGSGQALKWGKNTTTEGKLTQATSLTKKEDMEVIFMQYARRRRVQDQQQQPPPHQRGPQRQRRRQDRIFRTRTTLMGLRERDIIQRYRLNRQAIHQLLCNIEPQLAASLQTPHIIPPETKLLAVLHMLASGSFQTTGALVAGISQPSFSAFLPKVLDAIISLTPRHINFPNTQQKQQETKQGFYQINGFPHVLGAIDCTHVRIVPPAATEHLYRNRKHTHSINVQAIVDHQGLFTNIMAKYPGSVHDSFIFRHSTINRHFQDGRYGNGLLVADQGYGIQPWIMTPFGNPSTAAERAYNEAHRRTRTIVERAFGILKSRFRCLDITGGSLLYSPELVCKIILTCAILHNICVRRNIPLYEPEQQMPEEGEEEDAGWENEGEHPNTAAGMRRRQQIVQNFFEL